MTQEIGYKYKIPYSRSSIWADAIFGGFILIMGVACAVWVARWPSIFVAFVGLYLLWQAFKRHLSTGPQLMIGRAGLWTAATGHLPWSLALPTFKITANRSAITTYFIILNRKSLHTELARFGTDDLDVDIRSLKVYLDEFSPEKVETIV